MAYPILGTPNPQFLDSSGAPYASGTITTLDPADGSTVKSNYPTADDANASTNAVSADITLDASGRISTGYWGKDGEDYKVVLKDSSASTIVTMNDIRLPSHSRRATVALGPTDGTPTIAEGTLFTHNGTTAITDLDDGEVGDVVTIRANSGDASVLPITSSATLLCEGNIDVSLRDKDTITFAMFHDQIWHEIGRSKRLLSEDVTATNTITEGENGQVFYLNSATEFASTLPAPAAGLHFTFIVDAAPSGAAYTIGSNSGDNVMDVFILDIVGELTYTAARDVITFADGVSVAGDKVEVFCDGSRWYCYCMSGANGGITTGVT